MSGADPYPQLLWDGEAVGPSQGMCIHAVRVEIMYESYHARSSQRLTRRCGEKTWSFAKLYSEYPCDKIG
jgi:hypothetical protein